MTDYRLKPNRRAYFDALYAATLTHRASPGMVYSYLPALAQHYRWTDEDQLWFAFLNGLTQNPITSLALFEQMPRCPQPGQGTLLRFAAWFEEAWPNLQFDTDRLKNKRGTVQAIETYARLVKAAGSQRALHADKPYFSCWDLACQVHSFGRLSTFSYLEYVHLLGFGPDCDDLMYADLEGSRSHRNGLLMLLGRDELVLDKRANNGVTGYKNLKAMAAELAQYADAYLFDFIHDHSGAPNVSRFTFESVSCAFKNSFFGRRYMGVYADMAWDRILWAEAHGHERHTAVFKAIREQTLPEWLRCEVTRDGLTIKQRAAIFPETGTPYRAEHFLTANGEG